MKIIGVTGGIGSGKSTVSKVLSRLGAEIIDADLIAREIVLKGEKALEELAQYFGDEILDADGGLDRRKTASLVFNNREKLDMLSSITHKYVVERIIQRLDEAKNNNADIVVIDAPIPVEHGFVDLADEIWVVMAERETRIKRVIDRSGLSYTEAGDRINSQKKDEDYLKIADEVILNNGSIKQLEDIVVELFNRKKLGDIIGQNS